MKKYNDLPEISEIFADTVVSTSFYDQTVRIEFCVTRLCPPSNPKEKPTQKKYTSCRMVLTPKAANELLTQLQNVAHAIQQSKQPPSDKDTKH
jgi:hypothetical protein